MEINSITAGKNYLAVREAVQPKGEISDNLLGQTAKDFATTLAESEQLSKQAMTSEVDPHVLVQALAQTELAVETAVTVRNRVVEAYQEILRMPV